MQRCRRARNVAFGETDCAGGVRGRSRKKRRVESAFDLRQLCRAGARVLEIACGEQDLDGGGKHSGASCRDSRVEQNSSDRRGRRVDLALHQTKQRQSGLRPTSALVRSRVRRFGLRELAPKSMYLAEPVEGRARRWPRHQQRTRGLRILCRIIPFASPLHDFGAIEQALTTVAHEVRLRRTPLRERGRPLGGTAQVIDFLAALQDRAVDVAGEDRDAASGAAW